MHPHGRELILDGILCTKQISKLVFSQTLVKLLKERDSTVVQRMP